MTRPTVSVIVPVYNRAHLIGQTLAALLAQTRSADEIIVVDDGSTDGSAAVARTFGSAVQVVEMPNGGPALARNRGLAEAAGDFVQFMDSDDLPTPHFLAARLDALADSNADIAYGSWIPAWITGSAAATDGFVRQTAAVDSPLDAFLRGWILFVPNAMIRRSLLQAVGGYPEGLLTGEDMLLLFRLLRRTKRIAYTARSLLLIRQHPEGQISASAALTNQRIVDELVLTGLVRLALKEAAHDAVASRGALRAWETRRARAFARARRNGIAPPPEAGPPPNLLIKSLAAVELLSVRIVARLRQHRNGHRLEEHFHAAPIGPEHICEVRGLGLDLQQKRSPSL